MSPLKEIVDGIHSQVAKIEDDLKVSILLCYMKQVFLQEKYWVLECQRSYLYNFQFLLGGEGISNTNLTENIHDTSK